MTVEFLILMVSLSAIFPAYAYFVVGVCSHAYFKEKLRYQSLFFNEFDTTRKTNLGG